MDSANPFDDVSDNPETMTDPSGHRMIDAQGDQSWISLQGNLYVDLNTYLSQVPIVLQPAQQSDELIHTTQKHPFLTEERGFVPVAELHVGMHVRKADGSYGEITGWYVVPGVSVMYNLTVAQDHTYTVGDEHWVVHNCDNEWIKNLPSDPQKLIEQGWEDITHPQAKLNSNSTELIDRATGRKVRFDKGVPGQNGFEGVDHYHVYNPSKTGKGDYYLDINGNPVPKGSKPSHILPGN